MLNDFLQLATWLAASLTPQGWAMMLTSISVVLGLVSYCLYRVLTLPPVDVEEIRGPLDIDTGDTDDAD